MIQDCSYFLISLSSVSSELGERIRNSVETGRFQGTSGTPIALSTNFFRVSFKTIFQDQNKLITKLLAKNPKKYKILYKTLVQSWRYELQ